MDSSQSQERALAELRARLEAIESGEFVAGMLTGLRAEIRGWITDELNQIAERLEADTPARVPAAATLEPPRREPSEREREILEDSDFLPYAERVEEQLRAVERRVEHANEVVRGLATHRPSPGPEPRSDPVGRALEAINRISFEQLREFGLSVTQAARLLARRDARGSFRSLDELNDLVGFSREVLDQLRRRLTLS